MAGAAQAHKIVLGVVAGILVFVMHDLGGPAAGGTEWIAPQLPPPEAPPGRAVTPLGRAAPPSVPGLAGVGPPLIHPGGVFGATAAEVHAQAVAARPAAGPRRSLWHLPPPVISHERKFGAHAVSEPSLPKIRPAPGALSRGLSPHRTYLPDGSGKRRGNREFFVRRCREDGAGEAMHADRVPPAPRQRSRSARLSCSVPRPTPAMCSMTSLLASTNRSPGGRWISPRYGNGVSYLREAPGGVGGGAVRALARICRTRRGVTPASVAISWVETP